MTDALAKIAAARDQLARGAGADAYRALRGVFAAGPHPLSDTAIARSAISLLADLSRSFGATELADRLAACAAQPDDPNLLYQAGYDLYEQAQFEAAGALLFRANVLAPGQMAIVGELAGALEKQLRYGEAALVVDVSGLAESDPVATYLSGFSWLMAGDLDRPRERATQLVGIEDGPIPFMRGALEGMLTRADALTRAGIALDDRALTAWQAVISGSLLLHESPHGHDTPMRGRYAFVQDSAGLEREALERVVAVLTTSNARPTRVVAAPDRMSRILARAASQLLDAPYVEWAPNDLAPGLIVAWTMEAVEDPRFLQALHDHQPGQRLFVHAASWTEPFAYAADLTAVLHQQITAPWTGGALQVDPETRAMSHAPPDTRSDAEIGAHILTTPISDASVRELDVVISIARALAPLEEAKAAGLFRSRGKRLHQRAGGPVPSNRFT